MTLIAAGRRSGAVGRLDDVFRTLPAAGHPIGPGTILGSRTRPTDRVDAPGLRAPHVVTRSGTAALTVGLRALTRASARRRVVVPAYTCPSVAAAVLAAGLEPVPVDLERRSLGLDLDRLEARLASRDVLAVVPVHLFGIPEPIERIRELADRTSTFVVEDATQALGNTVAGAGSPPLGSIGHLGVFSFGRGKPVSALGGGALTINDPALAGAVGDVVKTLPSRRAPGSGVRHALSVLAYSVLLHPRAYWIPRAIPALGIGETVFRSEVDLQPPDPGAIRIANAVVLRLDRMRSVRRSAARAYRAALASLRGEVELPGDRGPDDLAPLRYPVLFPDGARRDLALAALDRLGLGATGMYPAPLHRIAGLDTRLGSVDCPAAEDVAATLLTLPVHEFVTPADVRRSVEEVRRALAAGRST